MSILDRIKVYKGFTIYGHSTSAKNRYLWAIRAPGFDRMVTYCTLQEAKDKINKRLSDRK